MNARYSTVALVEVAEAVDWYLSRPSGGRRLADRFVDELTRVEQLAVERPLAWPEVDPGVRRLVLDRFPFALIYEVEGDALWILAVAHHRRRPGYWRDRG